MIHYSFFFFFFQAEDGIRDYKVTGVQTCALPIANCAPVVNPFGPIDAPSADAPPIQFSLRARYDWSIAGGYTPFIQVAANHNGHSFTQAGLIPSVAPTGGVVTGWVAC